MYRSEYRTTLCSDELQAVNRPIGRDDLERRRDVERCRVHWRASYEHAPDLTCLRCCGHRQLVQKTFHERKQLFIGLRQPLRATARKLQHLHPPDPARSGKKGRAASNSTRCTHNRAIVSCAMSRASCSDGTKPPAPRVRRAGRTQDR
jgi:hypothetical protein